MWGGMELLLEDVGGYLQTQGVGTIGTDIFYGFMPDASDNCITLFEYAGSPPDLHWGGEYPGLQVRVRNKSYATGRTKIEQVKNALHGLAETTLGATRYLLVRANQSPQSLGRDANGRTEWVINFTIIKEVS